MAIRFAHTNLVAEDWRRLASFYQSVFGCEPVYPERSLSDEWLDNALALKDAQISGIHLRLPGHGETGPTLEIFQYRSMLPRPDTAVHRPGFAHIAFAVDDVAATAQTIREAGGRDVGRLTEREIPGAGLITFQYLADPEGNIVELQNWATTD